MYSLSFPVICPIDRHKESFRVRYVVLDGNWFPLPPDRCESSCVLPACDSCIADVIGRALLTSPDVRIPE